MFDEYAQKLEELRVNVPKVFKFVAGHGAESFKKYAVQLTDEKKLVDTGYYKQSWDSHVEVDSNGLVKIIGVNTAEYASFIEDGYDTKKAHFVPFDKMQGTTKATKFIKDFRMRYPNAKGFIAKPRRYKAQKIGKIALSMTETSVLYELRNEIEIAFVQRKYGLKRGEAKKYIK